MGDDAGARAGQDSQRGVREPPGFVIHFSLQSVYDMSFKTCNATEALCKIKSSRSIDVPSRRRGEDEGRVGTPEPEAVRQHRAYSLLSFRFERRKVRVAQIAKTGIQSLEVQRRRDDVRLAIARIANAASTAPAAPSKCPVAPFVDDTESAPDVR